MYQTGPTYAGIKVFNPLSTDKDLSHNVDQFKKALKDFLHTHSFILLKNLLCVKLDKQLYLHLVPIYMEH